MKKVVKSIARALVAPVLAISFSLAGPVATFAATAACGTDTTVNVQGGSQSGADCAAPKSGAQNLFGPNGVFITLTNILLFIIGAIAVVMLIIGGVRYVVSSGDQNAVTSAKNTILYAIIGIVIAFLAYAAVNFVSAQISKNNT
jgi:hypothetical protein